MHPPLPVSPHQKHWACAQVDATAAYMSTTARIGALATSAGYPCGSTVTLSGQSAPSIKVFTCAAVAASSKVAVSGALFERGVRGVTLATWSEQALPVPVTCKREVISQTGPGRAGGVTEAPMSERALIVTYKREVIFQPRDLTARPS